MSADHCLVTNRSREIYSSVLTVSDYSRVKRRVIVGATVRRPTERSRKTEIVRFIRLVTYIVRATVATIRSA